MRSLPPRIAALAAEAASTAAPLSTMDQRRLERFAELVTEQLGIRMPATKLQMLHGRVQRRMRELGLTSMEEYEERVRGAPGALGVSDEMIHFLDAATTNKTDFFREAAHFTYLTQVALPELTRERGPRWTCRVWCAGCSSGQEVYTLAMVLREYAATHPGFAFSIWATDVSSRVLAQAQAAIYPESAIEPIPEPLRQKYLLRSKDRSAGLVRIVPELRSIPRFARLNFMDTRYPAPSDFDVVFFRNVMIYFDKPTQEEVVNRQSRHLVPGGYFFIAHSESLAGLRVPLAPLGSSVFRRTR